MVWNHKLAHFLLSGGEKISDSEISSFYKTENGARSYFDFASGEYKPVPVPVGITILKSLKDQSKVIKKNAGASLIDLGDGVACVEFHSKMNALGSDQLGMIQWAVKEVEKNYVGLVIGTTTWGKLAYPALDWRSLSK
jgi:3-hydroxyacyl-CoA dehydrogenase